MSCRLQVLLVLAVLSPFTLSAWVPDQGGVWPDGRVPLALELNATNADASVAWEGAARAAIAAWNSHLQRVQLDVADSTGQPWYDNARSELFFDTEVYGERFPTGVLAITMITSDRGQRVEADIVFNRSEAWSLYRGAVPQHNAIDFRRVVMHELGHVLGLDHPDESGQQTTAIMNSTIGSVEAPTTDDRAGAHALYGYGTGSPPTILGGPSVSSPEVIQGVPVTFKVLAGGRGPFAYSWRRDSKPIAGVNSATLVLAAAELTDAGEYSVVVTNAGGSVTSARVGLAIQPAIAPTATPSYIPESTRWVGGKFTAAASLSAGTPPLRFEWRRDGQLIGTSSYPNFTVENLQFSDAGNYTMTAINVAGSVTTEAGRLSVLPVAPPIIARHPASKAVAAGERMALTVDVEGGPILSYRWQKDGVDIPGSSTSSLAIDSFTAADSGSYTVKLGIATGDLTSEPAIVTVLETSNPPVITAAPVSVTEFSGAALTFSITYEGTGPSIRWFKDGVPLADSAPSSPHLPPNFGRISGAKTATLRISETNTQDSGTYRVEVSNPYGSTSRTAQLIVLTGSKPLITAQPSWHSVAVGDAVSLSVGVQDWFASADRSWSNSPYVFQWFKDGQPIADGLSSNLRFNATLADHGRYFVRVTSPGGSVDSETAEVSVTSGQRPIITVHPANLLYDTGNSEQLRLAEVDHYIRARRSAREADTTSMQLVSASGPPVGGLTPGTYVVLATRNGVTETSRPFDIGFQTPRVPLIYSHPQGRTADLGESIYLYANATSYAPNSYQWFKDGAPISGATNSSLSLPNFAAADVGNYTLRVTSSAGTATSVPAILERRPSALPVIVQHPSSLTVREGYAADLQVRASGGTLRYQWFKDGGAIPGANQEAFTPFGRQPSDSGVYSVLVSNGTGSVMSSSAIVTIIRTSAGPSIIFPPASQTSPVGADVTFTVGAIGDPLPDRYQWRKDGFDIPGATDFELRLRNVQPSDAGAYSAVVSDAKGYATSAPATLTIDSNGRLINLATRAEVGTGDNLLIAGFVIGGTRPRAVMVRGIGDQLTNFDVSNVLRNPILKLFDGEGRLIAINDNWSAGGVLNGTRHEQKDALVLAAKQVGAFPLHDDTRDAALIATLAPGSYTAQVSGFINTSGVALVEIYELGKPDANRLINLSSRAFVGTGANILIPGLVVSGQSPRRLLIRAIGPGLDDFGVGNTLSDPVLTVYHDSDRIAQNDNWSQQPGADLVAQVTASVGGFSLQPDSRDAALVIDLEPGSYTVHIAGVMSATGVALVEVYEVSP